MEVGLIGQSGTTVIDLVILGEEKDKDGAIIRPQNITGKCARGMLLRRSRATSLHARVTFFDFISFDFLYHVHESYILISFHRKLVF